MNIELIKIMTSAGITVWRIMVNNKQAFETDSGEGIHDKYDEFVKKITTDPEGEVILSSEVVRSTIVLERFIPR